jgi:hypothetical protein
MRAPFTSEFDPSEEAEGSIDCVACGNPTYWGCYWYSPEHPILVLSTREIQRRRWRAHVTIRRVQFE